MAKKNNSKIKPIEGYILAQEYIPTSTFQSAKSTSGEDKRYEVLEVGPDVIDNEGIKRKSPCKVGDIVIAIDSSSTIEIDFQRYYFLHFTQVHGIYYEPSR